MQGVDQHVNWTFPSPLEQTSIPGRDYRQLPAYSMPIRTLIVPSSLSAWAGPPQNILEPAGDKSAKVLPATSLGPSLDFPEQPKLPTVHDDRRIQVAEEGEVQRWAAGQLEEGVSLKDR